MLKNMAKVLAVFVTLIIMSGCSSTKTMVAQEPNKTTVTTKKFETKLYAQDRKRVDQDMEGN